MGYNLSYGLQFNDSVSTFELESKEESENFLCVDSLGNLFVKREYGRCAECGKKFDNIENIYLHGNKEYCKKCEYKMRNKQRKQNKLTKVVQNEN